jgi:hypothetical protein
VVVKCRLVHLVEDLLIDEEHPPPPGVGGSIVGEA